MQIQNIYDIVSIIYFTLHNLGNVPWQNELIEAVAETLASFIENASQVEPSVIKVASVIIEKIVDAAIMDPKVLQHFNYFCYSTCVCNLSMVLYITFCVYTGARALFGYYKQPDHYC